MITTSHKVALIWMPQDQVSTTRWLRWTRLCLERNRKCPYPHQVQSRLYSQTHLQLLPNQVELSLQDLAHSTWTTSRVSISTERIIKPIWIVYSRLWNGSEKSKNIYSVKTHPSLMGFWGFGGDKVENDGFSVSGWMADKFSFSNE